MTGLGPRAARPWLDQADSDVRTAEALLSGPRPMQEGDVGCHVAALCAQAIEKALKGYMVLNHSAPAMNHRPDKYLPSLLDGGPLLRYPSHYGTLCKLFDSSTRPLVAGLLDHTPGGLGSRTDVPNTEYPWQESGSWHHFPAGSPTFANPDLVAAWVVAARRITSTLRKLWSSASRIP